MRAFLKDTSRIVILSKIEWRESKYFEQLKINLKPLKLDTWDGVCMHNQENSNTARYMKVGWYKELPKEGFILLRLMELWIWNDDMIGVVGLNGCTSRHLTWRIL
jgi:hypothetical protein